MSIGLQLVCETDMAGDKGRSKEISPLISDHNSLEETDTPLIRSSPSRYGPSCECAFAHAGLN